MSFIEFLAEVWKDIFILSYQMAPFWLPIPLAFILSQVWLRLRRAVFIRSQPNVLLEIKVPKEVAKSPLAMELLLNALHHTVGESTWYSKYIEGKMRASFSLEIVSIEGNVHFFIRTRGYLKKFLETQVYSQYPSAEIYEVKDYTHDVPFAQEGSDWDIFGAEFKLGKENPLPIKTYVDYNLDQDPKEELKIDPITPFIEYMGDIGRGEQIWLQILVRANKGGGDPTSYWTERPWQEEGRLLIEKIYEQSKLRSGPPPEKGTQDRDFRFAMLTEGERDIIKAIERNTSKLGFDCGIRALYLARKENFNGDNISGLFGTMKQYASPSLNSFVPYIYTDTDGYPWQKYINFPPENPPNRRAPFFSFTGKRVAYMKLKLFDAFRRRSWFFAPYEVKPFVLNAEELATIFHFPGRVSETPTFRRIESKKSEPPSDLPL